VSPFTHKQPAPDPLFLELNDPPDGKVLTLRWESEVVPSSNTNITHLCMYITVNTTPVNLYYNVICQTSYMFQPFV
jgi:hypothetical protein